jgi:hypothetical protein
MKNSKKMKSCCDKILKLERIQKLMDGWLEGLIEGWREGNLLAIIRASFY